ncbi:MAG TPA: hypothetical protein VFT47_02115 [Vicinamibacterales bacterium]|nr:hypothetical protein [Vicinamibacterales bacterium]
MRTNLLDVAAALSDVELIQHVKRLATNERQATAQLVAHLAEMDARRLYLGEGCSSLFTYCTQLLHLSEHAAYGRIEAARGPEIPHGPRGDRQWCPASDRRHPYRSASDG